MKECLNCGAMMNEEAKFCTNCGAAFADQTQSEPAAQTTNQEQPVSSTAPKETQTSQVVQNVSNAVKSVEYDKVAQGYWSYFVSTLKNPSFSFGVTDRTNGWIQFVLLTLLNALSSVTMLAGIPGADAGIGMFFQFFFVQFLISVTGIAILFLFKNFVQKVNTPFNIVTSQYGGLLSANVVLFFVILISSLISPIAMISIIMIGIALVGIVNVIGFNMYLLNGQNNSKLDNFYVTLLANAVVLIIVFIIARIGLEMMMDELMPYMYNQYLY